MAVVALSTCVLVNYRAGLGDAVCVVVERDVQDGGLLEIYMTADEASALAVQLGARIDELRRLQVPAENPPA